MDKKRIKQLAQQYGVTEQKAQKVYKSMLETADDHTDRGFLNITEMAMQAIIDDDPDDEELYFDLAVVVSEEVEK